MRSATFVWMRRRDSASVDTNNVVLRACRHFNQSPRTRLVNCTVCDSRLHSTLLSNGIDDVVGYAVRYEFNKRNFIVRSLFNYVWLVCFHLYYLHFCISLYTCANVICIKLLLTYLLTDKQRKTAGRSFLTLTNLLVLMWSKFKKIFSACQRRAINAQTKSSDLRRGSPIAYIHRPNERECRA